MKGEKDMEPIAFSSFDEIGTKKFAAKRNGYDPDEVNAYLSSIKDIVLSYQAGSEAELADTNTRYDKLSADYDEACRRLDACKTALSAALESVKRASGAQLDELEAIKAEKNSLAAENSRLAAENAKLNEFYGKYRYCFTEIGQAVVDQQNAAIIAEKTAKANADQITADAKETAARIVDEAKGIKETLVAEAQQKAEQEIAAIKVRADAEIEKLRAESADEISKLRADAAISKTMLSRELEEAEKEGQARIDAAHAAADAEIAKIEKEIKASNEQLEKARSVSAGFFNSVLPAMEKLRELSSGYSAAPEAPAEVPVEAIVSDATQVFDLYNN